jgi:hypothetical protein
MLQTTISKLALCAAGGAVAAMTAVGPATAAPTLPDGGGKVHKGWTKKDVWVHKHPSHRSPKIDKIRAHHKVLIKCKVRNEGTTWYKLAKRWGWVDARNVKTHSWIPRCRYTGGMNGMNGMNAAPTADFDFAPQDESAGEPLG